MATILCRKQHFDFEDKERSGAPKKFIYEELEALLDEDWYQTLSELAKSLGVDHTTVSKRLKALHSLTKKVSRARNKTHHFLWILIHWPRIWRPFYRIVPRFHINSKFSNFEKKFFFVHRTPKVSRVVSFCVWKVDFPHT